MVASFRQRLRIGWSVVVALAATALAASNAFGASPPAPASAGNGVYASAAAEHTQYAIKVLDPYVYRVGDGTLALNAPSAVANAVGRSMMKHVAAGLAQVNGEIRAGRLVATANHHLYEPGQTTLAIQGGWTGYRWQWWGLQIFLSEYYTQKVMALMAIGAGVFGICAGIPAIANQAVCVVLAGLLAIFGGILWFFDNGNGVVLNHTWWNDNWVYGQ